MNNNNSNFLILYPKNMVKIYSEYDCIKKTRYPIKGIKHYLQLIDTYSITIDKEYFTMNNLSITYLLKCSQNTITNYNKLLLENDIIEKNKDGIKINIANREKAEKDLSLFVKNQDKFVINRFIFNKDFDFGEKEFLTIIYNFKDGCLYSQEKFAGMVNCSLDTIKNYYKKFKKKIIIYEKNQRLFIDQEKLEKEYVSPKKLFEIGQKILNHKKNFLRGKIKCDIPGEYSYCGEIVAMIGNENNPLTAYAEYFKALQEGLLNICKCRLELFKQTELLSKNELVNADNKIKFIKNLITIEIPQKLIYLSTDIAVPFHCKNCTFLYTTNITPVHHKYYTCTPQIFLEKRPNSLLNKGVTDPNSIFNSIYNSKNTDELRSSEIQENKKEIPKEKEDENIIPSIPLEQGFNNTHSSPGHYQKDLKDRFNSLEIDHVNKFKEVWSKKYLEKTGNEYTFDSYRGAGQIRNFMLRMNKEIKEQNLWFNLDINYNDIINDYFDNDFWFTQKRYGFKNYNVGHIIRNFDAILEKVFDEKRKGK